MAKKKQPQVVQSPTIQPHISNSERILKSIKKLDGHAGATTVSKLPPIPFWLSTGDDVFDICISNRRHGGIPGGRITALDGLSASGKSLVCAHIVKSCQQAGGIAVVFDTQNAANMEFMQAIGVNTDDVVIYQGINQIEVIFRAIQQLLYSVKLEFPDAPLLIIIDSITACITQKDLQNKDYENKGFLAGLRAKMIGEALRKLTPMIATQNAALILTSQLRAKMDMANPYVDPYVASSGGMALPFYTTVQIRMQKKSKLKAKIYGVQTVIGVRSKARIDKSRLGPTYRQCQFDILYDCGIDNYSNWLQTLKKYKCVEGKGTKNIPWIVKFEDQQITIPGDFSSYIREHEQERNAIYQIIAKLLILNYKTLEQTEGRQIIVDNEDVEPSDETNNKDSKEKNKKSQSD